MNSLNSDWGDKHMRLNTVVTLGASIGFGLMGVFLARGWINSAIEEEFRYSKTTSTESAPIAVNTVPVLIADENLEFGDVLSRANVRVANYPEDLVPHGSFETVEILFDGVDERVVLSALSLNEPILQNKVSGLNGKASLSARIRTGYRAVSVRVNEVSGVAGFVVPGDVVDVIFTREERASNGAASKEGEVPRYISDVILQNITVLGVDQNQSKSTSDANVAGTVTLEVTNLDGQALNLAMQNGSLSLSLRGVSENYSMPNKQVKLSDLGTQRVQKKPYVKSRAVPQKVNEPVAKNESEVTIIRLRGHEAETVERLNVKREQAPEAVNEALALKLAGG